MQYHNDESKITYDEAERVVEQYIRKNGARRTHVTSKQVAIAENVDTSMHNLHRICMTLDDRLEISRGSGEKSKQFKIP